MKVHLSRRYAPVTYGIIQSAITAAVATTIATWHAWPVETGVVWYWISCWTFSWLAMLPVVVFLSPLIQRMVNSLIEPPRS